MSAAIMLETLVSFNGVRLQKPSKFCLRASRCDRLKILGTAVITSVGNANPDDDPIKRLHDRIDLLQC